MSSDNNCLYSVWNLTSGWWGTSTNYSTEREALNLLNTIIRNSRTRDRYEVRERQFGRIKE